MTAYEPCRHSPLVGLPEELLDDTHAFLEAQPSPQTESRTHLFAMVRQDHPSLTSRQIWLAICPFRSSAVMHAATSLEARKQHEEMISHLHAWFTREPLDRASFALWSLATMTNIFTSASRSEEDFHGQFEVRGVLLALATADVEEVFQKGSVSDLQVLAQRLMRTEDAITARSPWETKMAARKALARRSLQSAP
ncbi:hypothetical protein FA10DRAFT_263988 [Acaromyces ingoldii]|uniref:Uncharacterized protein n=1 Tax=Acaromyces ingoldii TaxID=215250 RepID=A0A316YWB2_9BASI|nr:hypothetical protein FA10DRAFT_263988 [Acaromyces ingoldii]PWN93326.1 hypothetical protein FA10DRAFT_263988 [Acaromyces ingoldii]